MLLFSCSKAKETDRSCFYSGKSISNDNHAKPDRQRICLLLCPRLFAERKYLCAQTNWIGIQAWGAPARPALHAGGVLQGEPRRVKDSSDLIGKQYRLDGARIMAGLPFPTFLFIWPY